MNVFGQSPILPSGSGINAKAQNMYDAGVPSNFIMDGDTIVRLNIVDGYLQSDNFITGSTGWQIKSDGSVEFNDGVFRGSLIVGSNAFHVDTSGNIWWGDYATYALAVAGGATRISSAGSAVFTSVSVSGYIISGGAATDVNNGATTISGTKITANSITASQIQTNTLTVGTNVNIGTAFPSTSAGGLATRDTVSTAQLDSTIIVGGYIKTSLIEAGTIVAGSVAAENITGTYITGKIVRTSSGGSRVELNGSDNKLYCFDGSGNIQGSIYGSADDLNIAAADNVNIIAGARTALNLGYEFCVPYDDGHYTIGNNTGKGLKRVYSYAFTNPSDRRLKKDIKTIESALDKVMKLRGVSFKWKKKDTDNGKKQIGLIAQEVKRVVPEVVTGKGGKEKYGIDYGDLAGLFVEAIKELNNKIK
jgi:hypothetical protein